MMYYTNYYSHCDTEWETQSDSENHIDVCPICGQEIEPTGSEELGEERNDRLF